MEERMDKADINWPDAPEAVVRICEEFERLNERISSLEAALREIAEHPHCNVDEKELLAFTLTFAAGHADGHRCAAEIARKALGQNTQS